MKRNQNTKAFTVRLPEALNEQIEARAAVNRRFKNDEIIHILETAIDNQVSSDLKAAKLGQKQG